MVNIYIFPPARLTQFRSTLSTMRVLRSQREPHVGARTFHETSACLKSLSLGPYAAQIWSRNPPTFEAKKPPKSTVRTEVTDLCQGRNTL